MITVVISTSNRLEYLKNTLTDLIKFSDIIDEVIIFCFNDFKTENYVQNKFKKKFKKIIVIKSRNNFEIENRIRDISLLKPKLNFKSEYIWFMSDKDRVLIKKCNSIKMILKKKINGLTMNIHSLKNPNYVKIENQKYNLFDLEKGVHKLGLISAQILSKRLFLKYSKQTKLSAYFLSEIILKIIINEKRWFFFPQKVIGYTHLDSDKNRNKLGLKYLNYRVDQELNFYILKLNEILSNFKNLNKKNIIYKAFFKNVISWLILLKQKENKFKFSKKIVVFNRSIKNLKLIKLFLLSIIYLPNFFIDAIKKFKKIN